MDHQRQTFNVFIAKYIMNGQLLLFLYTEGKHVQDSFQCFYNKGLHEQTTLNVSYRRIHERTTFNGTKGINQRATFNSFVLPPKEILCY